MMRQQAKEMLPLINDSECMRLLNIYVDWKIEQTRNELEVSMDLHRISELQGRVRELRRLKELPELVKDWVNR